MRKIITIIALTMLSGIALGQTKVGQLYYQITGDNTMSVVSGADKPTGSITIPTTVEIGDNTYTVTSIGGYAFSDCSGLTSVNIPNSVTTIEGYAFFRCSGLTSVNIPSSVTDIGWYAFIGCSGLTSIDIPNSVTSIGQAAFKECTGLTSVNIPSSVTSIGHGAFSGCTGLTSIDIPNSVTSIGQWAFDGCSGLTSVNIPSSVTNIGGSAFSGCPKLKEVTVNWATPLSVSNIFWETPINNATLRVPAGTVELYRQANVWKDFGTITDNPMFGKQAKVGQLYFNITSDSTVSVVPELPRLPFYNAGNAPTGSVTIPQTVEIEGRTYTVTAIGESAFDDCSGLTAITIPNTVTTIKDWAFANCSFTNITIPSSVTSIGEGMLAKCPQLTSINVDAANPAYTSQDGVLYSKDKTHLYIYPTKKAGAFVIPGSVTTVGKYAFIDCSEVTSINIPSSVTNIKEGAFWRCPKLKEVTVNWATPLRRVSDIFWETSINNATLRVPVGTVEQYRQANVWKNFGTITDIRKVGQLYYQITGDNTASVVPERSNYPYYNAVNKPTGSVAIPQTVDIEGRTYTITTIGNDAFYDCSGLTSIDIPNSVTSIGYGAFSGCSGLTSVNIPNSVTTIGEYAFLGCSGLTGINVDAANATYTSQDGVLYSKDKTTLHTCPAGKAGEFIIPNHVTNIGKGAFSACSKLTSVNIPNTITSIEESAFYGCSGLTSVNIPSSVTSVGERAFSGCSGLTSVNIPNTITSIGRSTFYGCSGLTSVNIPNAITSIGGSAFSDCSGLTSINIPSSVTSIGLHAFSRCSGLTSINIPNSVTTIENFAFSRCSGLREVTVNWTAPLAIAENVFYEVPINNATLRVPIGTVEQYRQANVWKDFGSIVEYGQTFVETQVTYTIQPNSQVSIGSKEGGYAGDVVIAETVTHDGTQYTIATIDSAAFRASSALTSVTIPASVVGIGDRAFAQCSALQYVYVLSPNPATIAMGQNVFAGVPTASGVRSGSLSLRSAQRATTLVVPVGSKALYEQAPVWRDFAPNIIERDFSSILSAVGDKDSITEIYNLRGERLSATNIDALPRGIYIVKKGGKAIKVVKP